MATRITLALAVAVAVLAACGAPTSSTPTTSPHERRPAIPGVEQEAPATPGPPAHQISPFSAAISDTLVGLVQDMKSRPDQNAVDAFAVAFRWQPISPEMNALLNAKRGYVGSVEGKTVLIGSDGTNDVVSLAVRDGFEPREILEALSQVLQLDAAGAETSMGQTMEIYTLSDQKIPIGLLSLTYGTAESLRGTGTLGFMSASKAKAEGFSGW